MFMLKLHFGYEKFSYIYFIIRRYKFVSQTLIPSVPNSSSQNLFSDSDMFNRLMTLKSKSVLNVAYRYFQCKMMKQTWKHLYFGQKLSPGVPVSSLVVLIKSAFIQLLEVRQN